MERAPVSYHLQLNVKGDLPGEVGSLLPKAVHSPRAELSEIERGACSVRAGGVDRARGCQAHKVSSQIHTNMHEVQWLQHPQEPQSIKAAAHCALQVPHTFPKGAIQLREFWKQ